MVTYIVSLLSVCLSYFFLRITELCKLRCFPPVAFAWDETSGLHVFTDLYSDTIVVDSSPALWSSPKSSEKTSVLMLVRFQLYFH